MLRSSRWLIAAALIPLAGCGGDGGGSGSMADDMMSPSLVTIADVQQAVFTPNCAISGCHTGPSPPQGLNLDANQAFGNLVGQPSVELPNFLRVDPGNAADSYLFMKVTGDPRITGSQMPLIGGPLNGNQIALIEDWIREGALPEM